MNFADAIVKADSRLSHDMTCINSYELLDLTMLEKSPAIWCRIFTSRISPLLFGATISCLAFSTSPHRHGHMLLDHFSF